MSNRIPGMKRKNKASKYVTVIAQGNRSPEDEMFQLTPKPKGMVHTMLDSDGQLILLERKDEHGNTTYKHPEPDPALKGVKGKNCNRTACQKPNAIWYHHDTHKYYCTSCARELNRVNYDAIEIYGHELLTLDPTVVDDQ